MLLPPNFGEIIHLVQGDIIPSGPRDPLLQELGVLLDIVVIYLQQKKWRMSCRTQLMIVSVHFSVYMT